MGGRVTELVAIDVGGTHARFALATIGADGAIALGEPVTLQTSDHVSLQTAWEEFDRRCDKPIPRAAAIAIAQMGERAAPERFGADVDGRGHLAAGARHAPVGD